MCVVLPDRYTAFVEGARAPLSSPPSCTSQMPFVGPSIRLLTDVSKPEVKDVSFGCVDVACMSRRTLSAIGRQARRVWSLSLTSSRISWKRMLSRSATASIPDDSASGGGWGELACWRLSCLVRSEPITSALDDAQTASDEAKCWDAHAGVVSPVQVVARPQAIVTAGEDGMARVWTWTGEPIGLMDVNAPEGNGIPWHFRTAAFEEHGSNGEARDMLREAKAAAAFYAGMKSRATRDEKARARQIALTKLKQGTPEGLEDLASHTIRSRRCRRDHLLLRIEIDFSD